MRQNCRKYFPFSENCAALPDFRSKNVTGILPQQCSDFEDLSVGAKKNYPAGGVFLTCPLFLRPKDWSKTDSWRSFSHLHAFSPPKGLEKDWLPAELFALAPFFSARGARQEVLPAGKLPGLRLRMPLKRKNGPDRCPGHSFKPSCPDSWKSDSTAGISHQILILCQISCSS